MPKNIQFRVPAKKKDVNKYFYCNNIKQSINQVNFGHLDKARTDKIDLAKPNIPDFAYRQSPK